MQLKVDGAGPFDFMVDSGLTSEIITPALRSSLGIGPARSRVRGLGSGGAAAAGDLVRACGGAVNNNVAPPVSIHAHIISRHVPFLISAGAVRDSCTHFHV